MSARSDQSREESRHDADARLGDVPASGRVPLIVDGVRFPQSPDLEGSRTIELGTVGAVVTLGLHSAALRWPLDYSPTQWTNLSLNAGLPAPAP